LRKLARELWDTIVDVFTDSITTTTTTTIQSSKRAQDISSSSSTPYDASNTSGFFSKPSTHISTPVIQPRDTQVSYFNRELIREFFLSIKNKSVKNIIISLLSTLYNIGDTMANNEIFSEYRHLWPSSLANANTLNVNSLSDVINSILSDSLVDLNPCNLFWLCTSADMCLAKTYYSDAIKYLIQMFACETKYFFKSRLLITSKHQSTSKKSGSGDLSQSFQIDDRFLEKNIKSIIKSCSQLNKHTQAALFCQFLLNNDYSNAFRFLQEGSLITPTSDEMDLLYNCIWDNSLIEFMTNLNAIRGFVDKKNICLKQCASQNLNIFNPVDITQKTVDCKKSLFFTKLINYYFLV
jgi:integrator complex subunit 8